MPESTLTKPGYLTTEFWVSLVTILCATVLLALHDISSAEWSAVAGGLSGVYTAARAVTKSTS